MISKTWFKNKNRAFQDDTQEPQDYPLGWIPSSKEVLLRVSYVNQQHGHHHLALNRNANSQALSRLTQLETLVVKTLAICFNKPSC